MDIHQILEKASKLKIAVVGDLIVDNYIYGTCERISPEAPIPVVLMKETKMTMGGAGNVFENLIGLGVDAELFCNYNGVPFWPEELYDKIHCNPYPAAMKTRVMCGNHHLLRVDDELTGDRLEWFQYKQMSWWRELMERFSTYDAVVIVDYHKGVVSDSVIGTLIDFKGVTKEEDKKDIPIIVDTKKDFHRYYGVNILKCNKKEWESRNRETLKHPIKLGIDWLVVTCGEAGISMYSGKDINYSEGIEGYPVNIVDVCGAGDTVTALLAIASGIGDTTKPYSFWVDLANIAASEVCKYPGVVPISKDLLIKRFNEVQG